MAMKLLDQRHRWDSVREGARITHTCRVCGITRTFETMIPEAIVEELHRWATQPNPYRALFR